MVESTPSEATELLCERYEQLRGYVLQGSRLPGQVYGFGVLLRQGMRAWMEACAQHTRPVEAAPLRSAVSRLSRTLPSSAQEELTMMMASMVLNNSQEEVEESWRQIPR